MELVSLDEYTKRFFEGHQKSLLESYPGLSCERLKSELKQIAIKQHLNPDHFLEETYIESSSDPIQRFFKRVEQGEPLEYISNRAYFYKSEFYVNKSVLIPRSETEILVEYVANYSKKNQIKSICDIGTGSGAIILSLLQEIIYPVQAVATELSEDALKVAQANDFFLRFKYPKETSLEFVLTDRLKGVNTNFDVIVSNPPYIKTNSDRTKVHSQVESHEPHMALYIDDEQYDLWFKELFTQCFKQLNTGGLFFMEGHEDHLESQVKLLESCGFMDVEVIKDYTNRFRFLKGIAKGS